MKDIFDRHLTWSETDVLPTDNFGGCLKCEWKVSVWATFKSGDNLASCLTYVIRLANDRKSTFCPLRITCWTWAVRRLANASNNIFPSLTVIQTWIDRKEIKARTNRRQNNTGTWYRGYVRLGFTYRECNEIPDQIHSSKYLRTCGGHYR